MTTKKTVATASCEIFTTAAYFVCPLCHAVVKPNVWHRCKHNLDTPEATPPVTKKRRRPR